HQGDNLSGEMNWLRGSKGDKLTKSLDHKDQNYTASSDSSAGENTSSRTTDPKQQKCPADNLVKHGDVSVGDERNTDQERKEISKDFGPEQDIDGLLEWWNTVEQKVRKGIRVFNKLFNEEAEGLWQHIMDLYAIADGIDRVNKKAKIASITGGSTSAVGGVATIAGLALAPVTMGTSLIVTAVGLGVTTAGGLTSASAGISNTISNSLDRKKVEQIVEDYQAKISNISKCLKFIKQGIENLGKYNVVKMKKRGYNQDFPELNSIYDDSAMAGKAIVCNAAEIMRVVHISSVAGSTAARAVQIASMASGVVTGLFVGMDIYFVAKDSHELRKGAKSEFAAKIREVADQLHSGLVELNSIRQELQEARI
ncbi:hypothetical protein Z043_116269, partial [Scleropages formosus]